MGEGMLYADPLIIVWRALPHGGTRFPAFKVTATPAVTDMTRTRRWAQAWTQAIRRARARPGHRLGNQQGTMLGHEQGHHRGRRRDSGRDTAGKPVDKPCTGRDTTAGATSGHEPEPRGAIAGTPAGTPPARKPGQRRGHGRDSCESSWNTRRDTRRGQTGVRKRSRTHVWHEPPPPFGKAHRLARTSRKTRMRNTTFLSGGPARTRSPNLHVHVRVCAHASMRVRGVCARVRARKCARVRVLCSCVRVFACARERVDRSPARGCGFDARPSKAGCHPTDLPRGASRDPPRPSRRALVVEAPRAWPRAPRAVGDRRRCCRRRCGVRLGGLL